MSPPEIPDAAYTVPLVNVLHMLDGAGADGWSVIIRRGAELEPHSRVSVEVSAHGVGADLAHVLNAQPRNNEGTSSAFWSGTYTDMEHRECRVAVTAPLDRAATTLREMARDLADTAEQYGVHDVAELAREAARAAETGGAS